MTTRIPAHLRHLVPAAILCVTAGFGFIAFPATAAAAPAWDIEEYDYCLKQTTDGVPSNDPVAQFEEAERYCCYRSGGVYNGQGCVAPPAQGDSAAPPPRAGIPIPSVQPPIVGPPPKSVIGPTAPMQPPTIGTG